MANWWSGYAVVVVAMIVGLVLFWSAPIGFTLINTHDPVACAPLVGAADQDVELIPSEPAVRAWLEQLTYETTGDNYTQALAGLADACNTHRENRATAVGLAGTGVAALSVIGFVAISRRPRSAQG